MRLLALCGSLRAASCNRSALEAAARLAPRDVEVVLYERLGELPHFNPDIDSDEPPALVRELRREVGRGDGLLVSSPEYAHGVAGSMKNALDWLVRGLEFAGKPVAVLNASPRAVHADAQLREILRTMAGRLVEPASISLPLLGTGLDAAGIVRDPILSAQLTDALAAFVAAIESYASDQK
jgi:chromate reductase, NAD(P)H dehydrogenase (quinone)